MSLESDIAVLARVPLFVRPFRRPAAPSRLRGGAPSLARGRDPVSRGRAGGCRVRGGRAAGSCAAGRAGHESGRRSRRRACCSARSRSSPIRAGRQPRRPRPTATSSASRARSSVACWRNIPRSPSRFTGSLTADGRPDDRRTSSRWTRAFLGCRLGRSTPPTGGHEQDDATFVTGAAGFIGYHVARRCWRAATGDRHRQSQRLLRRRPEGARLAQLTRTRRLPLHAGSTSPIGKRSRARFADGRRRSPASSIWRRRRACATRWKTPTPMSRPT